MSSQQPRERPYPGPTEMLPYSGPTYVQPFSDPTLGDGPPPYELRLSRCLTHAEDAAVVRPSEDAERTSKAKLGPSTLLKHLLENRPD